MHAHPHTGYNTDGSNHSQLLLSPARTEPTSHMSLVDLDPSAHGGNHSSRQRSTELKDAREGGSGSGSRRGGGAACGVMNSAVPLAGGSGSSLRGSIAAAALARHNVSHAGPHGHQGAMSNGGPYVGGGVHASIGTGPNAGSDNGLGTGGVSSGQSVWRFDDPVPAARAAAAHATAPPQQQQQHRLSGNPSGAAPALSCSSATSECAAYSTTLRPPTSTAATLAQHNIHPLRPPTTPTAFRFSTAGEEWGPSHGGSQCATGSQSSRGTMDAYGERDALSGESRGASLLAARLPDGRHHGACVFWVFISQHHIKMGEFDEES